MIRIRFFAVVRERLGVDQLEIDGSALPSQTLGAALNEAVSHFPDLEKLLPHVRIAVDHDFVSDLNAHVDDHAEIALIPPVSGGSGNADVETVTDRDGRFVVTTAPLDAPAVAALTRRHSAGALITFEGTVRDHTGDHDVDFLVYEAYPEMALKKLVEVSDRAAEQWPASVAIHHRYGRLELGDTAVVIAVSTPHRADGYACSQWIIDRLKEEVPIWKKEVGPDGEEWVGFGP